MLKPASKIIFSSICLALAARFLPSLLINLSLIVSLVIFIALVGFAVRGSTQYWRTYALYSVIAGVTLMTSIQVSASDTSINSDSSSHSGNQFNQFSKNEIILDEPELLFGTSTIRQVTENTIFVNEKIFKQITENAVVLNNGKVIAIDSQPVRSYRLSENAGGVNELNGNECESVSDGTLATKLIQLINCD
ncbi:MAG TPA: hypothetical protein PKD96_00380 [Candidatus Absconditabacterales bacterium]|nr:hypothetical protein [Candidatus Absconditabacterales bacterium]